MTRSFLATLPLVLLGAGCRRPVPQIPQAATPPLAVPAASTLRFSEDGPSVHRVGVHDGRPLDEPVAFGEGLAFLLASAQPDAGAAVGERALDYWVAEVEAGESAPATGAAQVQAIWRACLTRADHGTPGPTAWFEDDRVISYWVAEVRAGRSPPADALPAVQAAWFRLVAAAFQQPSPTLRNLFLKEARDRVPALKLDADRATLALQGG